MVRLKDEEKLHVNRALRFQFHYGTIKRLSRRVRGQPGGIFQFHYGTIKRRLFALSLNVPSFLSIPLWYD